MTDKLDSPVPARERLSEQEVAEALERQPECPPSCDTGHCAEVATLRRALLQTAADLSALRKRCEDAAGALTAAAEWSAGYPLQGEGQSMSENQQSAPTARHEHRFLTDDDGACWPCACGEPYDASPEEK